MRALQGQQLSGIVEAIATLKKVEPYLDVVTKVLDDPALPQVAERVRVLIAMHKAEEAAGQAPQTKGLYGHGFGFAGSGGIGLYKALKPLDAYIYYKQHKWILPVGVLAAVGVPLALGVLIGHATTASGSKPSRTRH